MRATTVAAFAILSLVLLSAGCGGPIRLPGQPTYSEALAVYEAEMKELDRLKAEGIEMARKRDDGIRQIRDIGGSADVTNDAVEQIRTAALAAAIENEKAQTAQQARANKAFADKEAAAKREGR